MTAVTTGPLVACLSSSGASTKAAPAETEALASENKSEAKEESKAGEGDVASTSSSKRGAEDYGLALVTDLGIIGNKPSNQSAWKGLKKYAEGDSISCRYYQLQEGTTDSYLEIIGLTIEDDAKLVVCPGFLFEGPIYLVQDKYPDMYFILLDGEPYDVDYNYKTNDSVVLILFQEGQAGFLAGYVVVKDDCTKLGFMGGMAVPAVIRFGYGFVQGAEFAAKKDGIIDLGITYNYTGALSATPRTQSMAASQYQNSIEVIFGCGGAVGNSVMAVAREENAKVVGMDVDQSAESETVIMSAMKLLSNLVYNGVKDPYDGSFLGGKTSVFIVANNDVGLPMDTSKFEKLSWEQYDTAHKRLVDGEIRLVQSSADNNDPTKDLIGLTNTKVTLIEQGLAAIRAVQGPEMTCGRQS